MSERLSLDASDDDIVLHPTTSDDFICTSSILIEPLHGSALIHVCTQLKSVGAWEKWPRSLVDQLVSLLAGRISGIIGYGNPEDVQGAHLFMSILPDWEAYSEANPWVKPIVDPTYLEIDVSSGQAAQGQLLSPVMPLQYPPLVGPPDQQLPPLVQVGGGNYSFAFAAGREGHAHAHHLLGTLQALNPGLRGKIYSTGVSPVLLL